MEDKNCYFEYELTFYDSDFDDEQKRLRGVVYATSFADAMCYLSEFYGEDNIVEVKKLYPVETYHGVYEFVHPDMNFSEKED